MTDTRTLSSNETNMVSMSCKRRVLYIDSANFSIAKVDWISYVKIDWLDIMVDLSETCVSSLRFPGELCLRIGLGASSCSPTKLRLFITYVVSLRSVYV